MSGAMTQCDFDSVEMLRVKYADEPEKPWRRRMHVFGEVSWAIGCEVWYAIVTLSFVVMVS